MTQLMRYPEVFSIQQNAVTLNPAFRDYTERSAKVEAVLRECRAQGTFITLKGWRDEVNLLFLLMHWITVCFFVDERSHHLRRNTSGVNIDEVKFVFR